MQTAFCEGMRREIAPQRFGHRRALAGALLEHADQFDVIGQADRLGHALQQVNIALMAHRSHDGCRPAVRNDFVEQRLVDRPTHLRVDRVRGDEAIDVIHRLGALGLGMAADAGKAEAEVVAGAQRVKDPPGIPPDADDPDAQQEGVAERIEHGAGNGNGERGQSRQQHHGHQKPLAPGCRGGLPVGASHGEVGCFGVGHGIDPWADSESATARRPEIRRSRRSENRGSRVVARNGDDGSI